MSTLSRKLTPKSKEEIRLKEITLKLTEKNYQVEDETLDFVLSIVRSNKIKDWRKLIYASRIILSSLQSNANLINKFMDSDGIQLFVNILNGDIIHKSDEVRQNILECLYIIAKSGGQTNEVMVEKCNLIPLLYTLYCNTNQSSPDSPVVGYIIRIFKVFYDGKYKDNILETGFDKNLFKKSNKKFSVRDSLRKHSFHRSPNRVSYEKHSSVNITKKSLESPKASPPPESAISVSAEVRIPPFDLKAEKKLKRKSAPSHSAQIFKDNKRLNTANSTKYKSKPSPISDDDKPERTSPPIRQRRKRSKSTKVTSTTIRDSAKLRVKCRLEEDLRFIWVDKTISVQELRKAIETEYGIEISLGQLKYSDPSDKDDLMTVTKREDLDYCFSSDKPEIYILSSNLSPPVSPQFPIKNISLSKAKIQETPPSPTSSSPSGTSPPVSTNSSRNSRTKKQVQASSTTIVSRKSGNTPTSSPRRQAGLRREHTDGPSIPLVNGGESSGKNSRNTTPLRTFPRMKQHSANPDQLPVLDPDLNRHGDVIQVTHKSNKKKIPTSQSIAAIPSLHSDSLDRWKINFADLKINDTSIGGGYFGEVKMGYWRGIPVACKVLYEKSFRQKSDLELFDQEVSILSSLRHPNVILYMGVCVHKDKIIVMEYMENGSLHDLLRRSDLHPNQIHKIAKEIALGMNYLHGESILHRDLTSKNILLSKHMEAKVADFGLSKVKMGESQTFSDTIGSLAWMAPEVIANAKKFSKSSDVYSYGILLWELWTGRDPCPTDIAPVNLANKVLHDNYRPEIPPHVPKEWQDLIKVCWDTDVGVRPTFEKILQILESIPHQNLHVVPLPHTYAQSVIPHTQTFPHHSDVHVIPHTQTFPRHGHGGSFTAPERCTVPTHASLPVIGTDELSSVRGSDYADMLGADVDQ